MISIQDFKDKAQILSEEFLRKRTELETIQDSFIGLVNSLSMSDLQDRDDLSECISDYAYNLDLEWCGNFKEHKNNFWNLF